MPPIPPPSRSEGRIIAHPNTKRQVGIFPVALVTNENHINPHIGFYRIATVECHPLDLCG